MAGEVVLPIQECPDDFQTISVVLQSDGSGEVSNNQTIHYCERDTIVDAAFIRFALGDDDATWTLEKCPDGTAVASGVDLSNAVTHATALNNKVSTFTIVETANIVEAGSAITVKCTGTSTAKLGVVTLRVRTRVR